MIPLGSLSFEVIALCWAWNHQLSSTPISQRWKNVNILSALVSCVYGGVLWFEGEFEGEYKDTKMTPILLL